MMVPIWNGVNAFNLGWKWGGILILGCIFLTVGTVWLLQGVFLYRKLLDRRDMGEIKEDLKLLDEPLMNIFVRWQSRSLIVRQYHRRALVILENLQNLEQIHSQIIQEHLKFSEETGARKLYEQRRLQKIVPETNTTPNLKRL